MTLPSAAPAPPPRLPPLAPDEPQHLPASSDPTGPGLGRPTRSLFRQPPVSRPRNRLRALTTWPECFYHPCQHHPCLPKSSHEPPSPTPDTHIRPLSDGLHPAKDQVTVQNPCAGWRTLSPARAGMYPLLCCPGCILGLGAGLQDLRS